MTGGFIGEMFASLAFAGALVAVPSLFLADREQGDEQENWSKLGLTGFGLHIAGVLGMIGTLFYLIYTQQYQYHYVWSHSSNELPIYYIVSCFWEGQEGSFLLWCFWHSILGGIIMWRTEAEWRNVVLAVIASVELILSSMILGVYVPEFTVYGIFVALALLPAAFLIYQFVKQKESLPMKGLFHIASAAMAVLLLLLIVRGQTAFASQFSWGQMFSSFDGFAFGLFRLLSIAYLFLTIAYISQASSQKQSAADAIAGVVVLMGGYVVTHFDPSVWKLGSTPFMSLQAAMPNAEVFQDDPDFIPANGSGLNPLLQNYWMVIHPPTLFLGFASTVVPFAFVIGGLLKGKYREWIRPATPWMLFSMLILGVGIIMGGYWAYETLNFGGYWNWDPVENSSFVPWLCGIGALHSMLIHQKTKSYLKMTMITVMATFLLVLYSTFLTRSGILGESSVHTFTDLGLSGQLLLLVAVYTVGMILLLAFRWKEIPEKPDESKVWSTEFFVFLGILVLLFSAFAIILTTSLPVVNAIFGTKFAPPSAVQFFYYKWTIWFAVAFGALSAIGQFMWWRVAREKKVSEALFRPFLAAMLSWLLIFVALQWFDWEFAYNSKLAAMIEPENVGTGISKILNYIGFGFLAIADEALLFSALFVVFANTDVLLSLLKKNKKGLKVMGGTVVHIGFGLMLLGILFSSGYERVISKNLTPAELAGFPEDEQADNVLLVKGKSRLIQNYRVTYQGKKEAKAPISDLRILEANHTALKVAFKDSTKDVFSIVLPADVFFKKDASHSEEEPVAMAVVDKEEGLTAEDFDMEYVEEFLNTNIQYLKPPHINNRTLYQIHFQALKGDKSFTLYPEAELNESMEGLIAHPSRKIYLGKDVYVHVSSTPDPKEAEPQYKYHEFEMEVGDTVSVARAKLQLLNIANLTTEEKLKDFDVAAAAQILVTTPTLDSFLVKPVYVIGKDNRPGMLEDKIDAMDLSFAFVGIQPEQGKVLIQVQENTNPNTEDWIVLKAIQKPFINILWLGTFILAFGFLISIYRRMQENRKR